MFHVFLALPVLIILGMIVTAVLVGIVALIAGIVGGATTAALMKNPAVKRLLSLGFIVVALFGSLCVIPIVLLFVSLSGAAIAVSSVLILVCMTLFSVLGIIHSIKLSNKIGKAVAGILFSVVTVISFSAVIIVAAGAILTANM